MSFCQWAISQFCIPMESRHGAIRKPWFQWTIYRFWLNKCFSLKLRETYIRDFRHYISLFMCYYWNNFKVYIFFFANPKSAMIAFPLFIKIFANLRSLCRKRRSPIYTNPFTMSLRMLIVSDSDILRFFFSN